MKTAKGLMGRRLNQAAAVVVALGLLYVGGRGVGPLPPLGQAFNPGTGVWTMAPDSVTQKSETIEINGLYHPVRISFDKNGTAYIHAQTDHDLFVAMGYLHATNRLFQMDLMRRQGEGLLSQVVGKKALPSDEFEDELGLERTAQAEWADMSPTDPARRALNAYTVGVNDVISQDEETGHLPVLFKLLGYKPAPWTPIDSLVIQGDMTQTLDFSTGPLEYALLVKSLGYKRAMTYFPVLPIDKQSPYDVGPYKKEPLAPIESQIQAPQSVTTPRMMTHAIQAVRPITIPRREASAVTQLLKTIQSLPATAIHHGSNSNNWAVSPVKTQSGRAMLAGDPHLNQTLPSIWYQVSAQSPHYQFQGVSIPGLPLILIGKTPYIAWSLTNVQNQATLFYQEKTSPAHPNAYFWNGKWMKMDVLHLHIPVKGEKEVPFTVRLTVHGPNFTENHQTLSVDWMGALPSPDMDAMLKVIQSHNFDEFKQALQNWHAPTQNFIYADASGNIGLISAGYYPIVKSGDPWLPLRGDGSMDVIGTIPYDQVPQAYNPPSHILFSANQREVSNAYPYYIGTTMDFFDNGYRADEIAHFLSTHQKMTNADFARLQNDTTDYLATEIVPKLLRTLSQSPLSSQEENAISVLRNWNDRMDVNAAGATIWWTFWTQYLDDTFHPWWAAKHVPTKLDPNLSVTPNQPALDEDLEAWTLSNNSTAFTLPNGQPRTPNAVMTEAFKQTVAQLTKQLGSQPQTWAWGRVHERAFPSLAEIASLGYGPKQSGGDLWTVDAADGGLISSAGPSWRMIVNFDGQSQGVYPGGQSENPISPWYENQISTWWNGLYNPISSTPNGAGGAVAQWVLHP